LYDFQQPHSYLFVYGNDTVVLCQAALALTLWHLRCPDQALRMSLTGLSRAQELSHPFTHACALYFTAALHRLRRERAAVQALLEPLLQLCQERGFVLYASWGTAQRGWTLAEQGEVEQGIEQIQQGLDTWRAMGAELLLPEFLACLDDAGGGQERARQGSL
jgi:predicted ATPase